MSQQEDCPPPQPPVPFSEFDFTLNGQPYFPLPTAPLPLEQHFTACALFSQTEETSLLGFLDNFDWDMGPASFPTNSTSNEGLPSGSSSASSSNPERNAPGPSELTTSSPEQHNDDSAQDQPSTSTGHRSKPLLTLPQKRMNHILSEQKRRNAIRDGYATLSSLIAPGGKGGKVPTRGRPRGSGRGRGRGKGKSGVLFRAVEYCKWLDDSIEALEVEVQKIEQFAGIQPPS